MVGGRHRAASQDQTAQEDQTGVLARGRPETGKRQAVPGSQTRNTLSINAAAITTVIPISMTNHFLVRTTEGHLPTEEGGRHPQKIGLDRTSAATTRGSSTLGRQTKERGGSDTIRLLAVCPAALPTLTAKGRKSM